MLSIPYHSIPNLFTPLSLTTGALYGPARRKRPRQSLKKSGGFDGLVHCVSVTFLTNPWFQYGAISCQSIRDVLIEVCD